MARNVQVKLNSREIQSYLDGDHGVSEMLREKAERVLSAAIDDPHDDTGEYEASLHIEEAHTDRLVVRVVADAYHAWIVESRFGVLARALDAAG